MKILLVTADYDDRILAVLEFKKLNAAHAIEFVSSKDELVQYLNSKNNCLSELPNLILINSNIQTRREEDALSVIKSIDNWQQLNVVVFSTYAHLRDIIFGKDGAKPFNKTTDPDELVWIFKEICVGLATKEGWQHRIVPTSRAYDSAA